MRIAVVTESFLPQVNGVTNSVLRVCEHLERAGHEALIVAPGPGPTSYRNSIVVRTPSVPLPGYRDFRLARPWRGMDATLREFQPDLVHLASPTVLGAQAAFVARRIGVPVVAVYQTDLAGYAARYGLSALERSTWRWLRQVHSLAARTLAPSRHAVAELQRNGVDRVARWARGVDLQQFAPQHRDPRLRAVFGRADEVVVGYVGRLAHEKEVGLLAELATTSGVRLVVAGDGPQRSALQRMLPQARFLGFQHGGELARTFASLDVFVHTGSHETFCQAAQEALASGLPVVAPAAGGLLDLVEDDVTGRLFRPHDAADLRDKVLSLVADDHGRARLARAARTSVEGRGWDVIGEQLMGHYDEVLSA